MRAVVGHRAVKYLEDDRLCISVAEVDDDVIPCVARNTQANNLESVILNGIVPGGDGTTKAGHSQLSAFHMTDDRVQGSSRASKSDVIIFLQRGAD